jgi:hypothetical protein
MMERGETLAKRENFNTVIEEKLGINATRSAETQPNQGIATSIDKIAVEYRYEAWVEAAKPWMPSTFIRIRSRQMAFVS